jgi:hypothetical protein
MVAQRAAAALKHPLYPPGGALVLPALAVELLLA